MTILHFPPYYPNECEMRNAKLYAENVRHVMQLCVEHELPEQHFTLANEKFIGFGKLDQISQS